MAQVGFWRSSAVTRGERLRKASSTTSLTTRAASATSPPAGARPNSRVVDDRARKDLVRTFSRGMQQRLAIGRAVLHNPEVMLFDEPYTGLDQDASAMLDEVLKTVAAQGRTVVMTSHDLARAEDLATRFDILSRGIIAASITRRQLKKSNLLTFYKQALAG